MHATYIQRYTVRDAVTLNLIRIRIRPLNAKPYNLNTCRCEVCIVFEDDARQLGVFTVDIYRPGLLRACGRSSICITHNRLSLSPNLRSSITTHWIWIFSVLQ